MSSTEILIPKEPTFKLPQGRFKAVIQRYKTDDVDTAKGKSKIATILFEVEVPGKEDYECLARKVMIVDLKAGSVMRRFLEGLLGQEFFKTRLNKLIDPKVILEGKLCEVELFYAKHDEDKYDFPLVDVEAIYPRQPELVKPQQEGGKPDAK